MSSSTPTCPDANDRAPTSAITKPAHETLAREWRRHEVRRRYWFAFALAVMMIAGFLSLGSGVTFLGPGRLTRILLAPLLPSEWYGDLPRVEIEIIRNLRLPRTLMAVIAGAGLSMSGAAMQGLTRNVLVSPYTIGISPAAAFGASLAILFGFGATPVAGPYLTVAAAFLSALCCAAVVLGLSALRGMGSTTLILTGISLTYLFGALTATVQFVGTEQQLAAIVHWTFGSLNGSTWNEVSLAAVVAGVTFPLMLANAAALNAFAAGGDEIAASLGFAVARTRLLVTVAAVLVTACIVSFVGVIGFVGLVAPHIARLTIGGDHRFLLPFSAIVGASLLLFADLIGRFVFAPIIVPVGIVVAYVGVPIFLQLLLTRQHGED